MAFVPGYKHDLFLSYAHFEAAWAEAFTKALGHEFQERTGDQVTFWQDSKNLRLGEKWTVEIEEGIRSAAAFLAIVSPTYLKKPWCAEERRIALEKSLEALKVDSFYRFLKVIKTPGPGKAHEELLSEVQDIRFFNAADDYELPAGSAEYTAMIRACFRHIHELLALMSNKGRELYAAPGAIEMYKEREELVRNLKDRGFTIKPDILLDSGFGKGPIRKAMGKAEFVLFVFGAIFDEFTAAQIEVAQELGKPVVFWVQPGDGQKNTLPRIQELRPPGSEVLGGRSIQEMLPQLLEKLKPKPESQDAVPDSGTVRVYLNYDSTLSEDSRIATHIGEVIRSQFVWGQHPEVVRSGRDGDHEGLMRTSQAVLLFRAANPKPDEWLNEYAKELALPWQIFEKSADFDAKALLVTEPERVRVLKAAGVPVYPYSEAFAAETLDPFFDSLRKARSADAPR
jgi:hypothetical protein